MNSSPALVLIFASLLPLTVSAVTCQEKHLELRAVGSVCADWAANRNVVLTTYEDGSKLYNPAILNQVKESVATTETPDRALLTSFRGFVDEIKSRMIDQIRTQSSPENMNGHQLFLLHRLNTLNIKIEHIACDYPFNASYQAAPHTLIICPFVTRLPKEAALGLIAHELGHMADPCNYIDVYSFSDKIKSQAENRTAQKRLITKEIQNCLTDVPADQVRELSIWATGNTRLAAQAFTVFASDHTSRRILTERLVTCGVAKAPVILAPKKYEGSPYLSMISCVSEKYPLPGTPTPVTGSSDIGSSAVVCDSLTPQVKETVADYIGSSLTAFALNKGLASGSSRGDLVGYFFNSVHCDEKDRENSGYAQSSIRMNIFLQPGKTRAAVGCTGEVAKECTIPAALLGE